MDVGVDDARPHRHKRLLGEVFRTSAASAGAAAIAMAVAFYSAGALGAADRGLFVSLITGAALCSLGAALGVGPAARRMLVNRSSGIALRDFVIVSIPLSGLGAVLGSGLVLVSPHLLDVDLGLLPAASLVVLSGTGTANLLLLDAVNAQGKTAKSAIIAAAGVGSSLVLLVVVDILQDLALGSAIVATTVGSTFTTVLLLVALRGRAQWGQGGSRRALVRAGLALAPFALAQAVAMRLDRVLFPALGDASDAGVYSIAAALAEVLRFGSLALAQQLVFRAATNQLTADTIRRSLTAVIAIQLSAAALIGLGSIVVIPELLGDDYASVPKLFAMMVVGEIFMTWYLVSSRVLLGRGATTVLSVGAALGAITMIVGDVLLIPRFGAEGAAIASVVAYAVLAWTASRALRKLPVSQS